MMSHLGHFISYHSARTTKVEELRCRTLRPEGLHSFHFMIVVEVGRADRKKIGHSKRDPK